MVEATVVGCRRLSVVIAGSESFFAVTGWDFQYHDSKTSQLSMQDKQAGLEGGDESSDVATALLLPPMQRLSLPHFSKSASIWSN